MSNISAVTTQASSIINSVKDQNQQDKLAGVAKSASTITDKDLKKIDKTAQDFEAVFVTEMLRPMMNMINVDPQFGGGKGEEVFRDFTLNEYGKQMASQGGFGIATHVKEQLIRMQAQAANPHATPRELAITVRDAMAQSKTASPTVN